MTIVKIYTKSGSVRVINVQGNYTQLMADSLGRDLEGRDFKYAVVSR